jgi:hypothetical protein
MVKPFTFSESKDGLHSNRRVAAGCGFKGRGVGCTPGVTGHEERRSNQAGRRNAQDREHVRPRRGRALARFRGHRRARGGRLGSPPAMVLIPGGAGPPGRRGSGVPVASLLIPCRSACAHQDAAPRSGQVLARPIDVERQHRERRAERIGFPSLAAFGRSFQGRGDALGVLPGEDACAQIQGVAAFGNVSRPASACLLGHVTPAAS